MYEVETNIENKAAYNANVAYYNVSKRKNTVPEVVQSSKRQALCIGTPQNTDQLLESNDMFVCTGSKYVIEYTDEQYMYVSDSEYVLEPNNTDIMFVFNENEHVLESNVNELWFTCNGNECVLETNNEELMVICDGNEYILESRNQETIVT